MFWLDPIISWNFQGGQALRGGQQEPVAIKTVLGWVLSAPVTGKSEISDSYVLVSFVVEPSPLNRKEVSNLDKMLHKIHQ